MDNIEIYIKLKNYIKFHSVNFAQWVDENCIKSFEGYFISEHCTPEDNYSTQEYELDELWDYYFDTQVRPHLDEKQS